MTDYLSDLLATEEGCDTLLKYIEDLVKDTWIDIPQDHVPIRRDLMLFAGEKSGFGARLPFTVLQDAIHRVKQDHQELPEPESSQAGNDNDSFSRQVRELTDSGESFDDSVECISGSLNLEMLGQGIVPAFMEMIKSMFGDLPIPESLTSIGDSVAEYMKFGLASRIPDNALLNKLSLGFRRALLKEGEHAHERVIEYARDYANSQVGTNPAKVWEAWAMYPTLRGIKESCAQLRTAGVPLGEVTSLYALNTTAWNTYIGQAATYFSNVYAQTAICCLIGAFVNLDQAKSILETLRVMFTSLGRINQIRFSAKRNITPNITVDIEKALVTKMLARLSRDFANAVKFLHDLHDKVVERIGGDEATVKYLMIDNLLNGLIGYLRKIKNDAAMRLRGLIKIQRLDWHTHLDVMGAIAEGAVINDYLKVIDEIEHLIERRLSCGLENDNRDQAIDLVKRLRQGQRGLQVHIKGQPLPPGMKPNSPLANLEPFKTPSGFSVEPGIQGSDIPTGELEELFDLCRSRSVDQGHKFERIQSLLMR
jgi:hypothetical protein